MAALFVRCLTDLAWRTFFPARAARGRALAQARLESPAARQDGDIARLLTFPWWEVRNDAVKLIHAAGDLTFLDALCALVRERGDVGIVRRNAVGVIAALAAPPAEEATLCAALDDPYWEVRREAFGALAVRRPGPAARAHMCRAAVSERSFDVLLAAAYALGASGGAEALAPLDLLARTGCWQVRLQSAVALMDLAGRVPEYRAQARACIAQVEHACAGVTARVLFWERMAALTTLLAAGSWPPVETVSAFYLTPGVAWTRQ